MVINIGVLELQGDFDLHHKVFERLGINSSPVKVQRDLESIDGLVIPGGESTTMTLLIDSFNLHDALVDFGKTHPVMGTCAGLIMMAKYVPDERVKPLGFLDVNVDRNAYGRQIESSTEQIHYRFSDDVKMPLATTFIRAPKITKMGNNIHVLGEFEGSPVAILSNHYLGLSFHPELDGIDLFHQILFDPTSDIYFKKLNQTHAA